MYGAGLLLGVVLTTITSGAALAQETAEVPENMSYVPFGPFIMGIDKDPAHTTIVDESAILYQRRMSMPWSSQAFHDEGPAHWVVLDGYFIDKYEVSNGDYARFMKETARPIGMIRA